MVGVYPVLEAATPCHLIELRVSGFVGEFDFVQFTQEKEGVDRQAWQVAYDEYLLNEDGSPGDLLPPEPLRISSAVRIAFFFHYLDLEPYELATGTDPAAESRLSFALASERYTSSNDVKTD